MSFILNPAEHENPEEKELLFKIEKIKARDEERKDRFFDSKKRLIGVDVKELERQLLERKLKKAEESHIDKVHNDITNMLAAEEVERKQQDIKDRKMLAKSLNNYRSIMQRKEFSREYDLNNRKADHFYDPTKEPGQEFFLQFEGIDDGGEQRRMNTMKLKEYLEYQIEMKKNLRVNRRIADLEWQDEWTDDTNLVDLCRRVEESTKKTEQLLVKDYNILLAMRKKREVLANKRKEENEKLGHIYHCVTSDLLCEGSNGAESALGPGKVNAASVKGSTDEEKKKLCAKILEQITANKLKQNEEKIVKSYFANIDCEQDKSANDENVELERKRKEASMKIANENLVLGNEQAIRREQERKDYFNKNPTEEFYAQFNKTIR